MDELVIAEKARKGDTTAFIALMNMHKITLYRTAFAFLKNEQDALEAVQEITVRAYKKIHTVKEPRYMKTWLIKIMMNYCQDQLKIKRRFISTEKLGEIKAYVNDSYLEIEEALETLPNKDQRLIHMKYFQDLKNKEIANIENIPEGTVKSRLHHCLKKLRKFLSEKGGTNHV